MFLASLCRWGDWFETHFVGNPEDRFCRVEAQIILAQEGFPITSSANPFFLSAVVFFFHFPFLDTYDKQAVTPDQYYLGPYLYLVLVCKHIKAGLYRTASEMPFK